MSISKNLKLYLLICLLGLGFIVSGITFIAKSRTYKNYPSTLADLKEQNKTLQTKLNDFELAYSQLENKNKQLQSDMDNFMQLQTLDYKDQKSSSQLKEVLAQKEKEYNTLQEQYTLLNNAYSDLIKEELTSPAQQQPEDTGRRQRPTQEQMDQMRTTARDRMQEAMDNRIAEAKTEYEAGLLTDIKQAYDDMSGLQEKFRTATDEERAALRDQMREQGRTLSQLYQDYNTAQWQSLSKEYGITNTDEFVKKAQELSQTTNSPFGGFGFGGRGGAQEPQGGQTSP